jgi:serine/threonine protein kinase/tetratricopeptide (TPR) repeat protein
MHRDFENPAVVQRQSNDGPASRAAIGDACSSAREDFSMPDSGSAPDPLGELAEEFLERYRRGERPALMEYTDPHPELAEQIRELFPALVMLEDVRPSKHSAVPQTYAPRAEDQPSRLGEYRIVREIGRGGMGIVYEAEQESLGRRVALKVLPPAAVHDPQLVRRFQREARAAARLHHTCIVPVFGVGEENGTYYYVMQYIEGCSLESILAELRHNPVRAAAPAAALARCGGSPAANPLSADLARSLSEGRFRVPAAPESPSPGVPARSTYPGFEPPPSLLPPDTVLPAKVEVRLPQAETPTSRGSGSGKTLTNPHDCYAKRVAHLGMQVADALEYASGQGVLHRDIKPSNLLLDVWGSIWLTDFGLAKATGTEDLTGTGDLLGTIRYMAPERFHGRADVRSDVYSLGLTLYEMLALRPAFSGEGQVQLMQQITSTTPLRLCALVPGLPRDLVTIVHKAMARDSSDRYQTPGALADDLRCFLDERPIAARRLGVLERARRWCGRNPMTATLMAVLLLLVGLLAGGGVRVERQRALLRARAHAAVERCLERLPGLRQESRWKEARATLAQAASRLDDAGSDSLRQQVEQALADLELVVRLEEIRLERATVIDGQLNYERTARAYAEAFAGVGLDPAAEEEFLARLSGSSVREQLIAALDDWAVATRDVALRTRLLHLARLADPDPKWRDRVRDPQVWQNRAELERLARQAAPTESPQLLTMLALVMRREGVDSTPLLRVALLHHPGDFWLNFELACTLVSQKKPAQAVGFYQGAAARRPDCAVVYSNLGSALFNAGHIDEAREAQQRAVELDPHYAPSWYNIGHALFHSNRPAEAITAYRRALELDPGFAPAHYNLGFTLQSQGDLDGAIAAYRRAGELEPRMARAHYNLGLALHAQGRLAEAEPPFRRAIAAEARHARAHLALGIVLDGLDREKEAEAAFREAIALEPEMPEAHGALGVVLLNQGQFAEARTATRRSLELYPEGRPQRKELRERLERLEILLGLEARLPAVLEGRAAPADAEEGLAFAEFCYRYRHRYAAAVRLYAAAFSARPTLAGDLRSRHRYHAACAAVLAAAGQGEDAAGLGPAERARLRRQALAWLEADRQAWARRLAAGRDEAGQAGKTLRDWQQNGELTSVRDNAGLAGLPEDERANWRQLWASVRALTERASGLEK